MVGSAVFLLIAPGFVVGMVPWWICGWRIRPSLLGFSAFRAVGGALAMLGGVGLLDSFRRFAVEGLGTPAPVLQTRRLIITGFYRHVRNPMYLAVVSAILGQALIFGCFALLVYAALVWLLCHIFVLSYEEPKLRALFRADYDLFCARVPRWIPRLTAWDGDLS